jgi:small subunit ribosomal protein S7
MRAKKAPVRHLASDNKYGSPRIAKFINYVMISGKKTVAQHHVYQTLEQLSLQTKKKPLEAFEEAIKNITPEMEVRSRRVGGAAYQVPIVVHAGRGFSLALRWLVAEANKRPNKQYTTFTAKLTAEMLDAINNTGGAVARKESAHKAAEANKAFAHFRW